MTFTEKNVLMQKIDENGNMKAMYPVTKIENVIDDNADNIDKYFPRRKTITLLTANWKLNTSKTKYEYRINDTNITENDCIEGNMIIEEQEKLDKTEVESFNGYYIIRTTKQPTANITMDLVVVRTKVEEVGT